MTLQCENNSDIVCDYITMFSLSFALRATLGLKFSSATRNIRQVLILQIFCFRLFNQHRHTFHMPCLGFILQNVVVARVDWRLSWSRYLSENCHPSSGWNIRLGKVWTGRGWGKSSELPLQAEQLNCKSLPFFYFLTFEKADCPIFTLSIGRSTSPLNLTIYRGIKALY